MAFVRRGYATEEIDCELVVTNEAIDRHLTRISTKTGVRNRQELRRLAIDESVARRPASGEST